MHALLSLLFLLTDYRQLADPFRWGLIGGLTVLGVPCAAALGHAICSAIRCHRTLSLSGAFSAAPVTRPI